MPRNGLTQEQRSTNCWVSIVDYSSVVTFVTLYESMPMCYLNVRGYEELGLDAHIPKRAFDSSLYSATSNSTTMSITITTVAAAR